MLFEYAGMNAAEIAAWLLIATAAGFIARFAVKGKNILGLWGDAAIGLIGCFAVGALMRAFKFNLTNWLKGVVPDAVADYVVWIDIGISALVGALVIRAVLRPITGGAG